MRRNIVKSGRRSSPSRHQHPQHPFDPRRDEHVGGLEGPTDEEEQQRQRRQRQEAAEEEEPEGAGGELDQQHHGY